MASLLLWEGRISRGRLIGLHGLSQVRASEWLRELRERHPDWVAWDPRARAYFATDAAYRTANKVSALAVPTQHPYLPGQGQSKFPGDRSNQSNSPVSVLPWTFSSPPPKAFATVHLAISERQTLRFSYRSMGNPEPHARSLEPHTLVQAGRRWHVRGRCPDTNDFRDFVLGRMDAIKRTQELATTTAENDTAWNTLVKVKLAPHPSLSDAQQSVVAQEYFAGTSGRTETCRGPLVPYFIQEVRAAVDVTQQTPPDYQLAVLNVEECRPWMFPA
jgi:hypothetical protein